MPYTIFVIDDDDTQLMLTEQALRSKLGYRTITARGGREAIERFMLKTKPEPSLLLLDLMMPEVNGMDVIKAVRRIDSQIPIIVMTAYGGVTQAVAAVEAGANDFLIKPVTVERLRLSIHNQLQRARLSEEVMRLSRLQSDRVLFSDLIGQDTQMGAAVTLAMRAADSVIPVAIQGEKGVGKELLARAIHGAGSRAEQPFISFQAQRDDEDQLAELLDVATCEDGVSNGVCGTLYINHIEDLSERCQQRLGALLKQQKHEWQPRSGMLRLITGSAEPLCEAMKRGDISEELYRELNAYPVALPPLRSRKADVLMLAEHFLQRFSAQYGMQVQDISAPARQLLLAYDWPGNVGELQRQVQCAVIGCDAADLTPFHFGTLLQKAGADLTDYVGSLQEEGGMKAGAISMTAGDGNIKPMHELEAEMIQYAIQHYGGRMSEVARRLGIGRSTLYRKIQDYNLGDVA